MKPHRMRVCIDFDGVIHSYEKGWRNGILYGAPIKGAMTNIGKLYDNNHLIYILTARPIEHHKKIEDWIRKHLPDSHKDISFKVSNVKPPAGVYLDDRAIHFKNWESAMKNIIDQIEKEKKRPD